MKRDITRRDFLNGTRVAIGASLLSPWVEAFGTSAFQLDKDYYPPSLTGLRGSHTGSWEVMHERVAGRTWKPGKPEADYDLVVVGAGISGLSAAFHYKRKKPDARILIIDNHDDFGGHAKRNEFDVDGATRIGYGGTESIDTPSSYTEIARQTLADIGVDTSRFYEYYDQELYSDLSKAIVFDEATYGKRACVTGYGSVPWAEFAANTPMTEKAKADFVRVFTDERDYLPGMSEAERRELLTNLSYYDFLKDYAKVDQQVLEMYRRWGISFWCVGIEEIPAIQVQGYDDGGSMPGLRHTLPRVGYRGNEPYIFHFPDGNASVVRLFVRQLLPEAVPGRSMEDVVTARIDYSKLDQPDSDVAIRLSSTVVNAAHSSRGDTVDVSYVRHGDVHTVRARHCIMACYNSAIPYLCPELPEEQVEGLRYNVKVPLTYTKIAVNNWRPFAELGVSFVYYTNAFYKQVELDYPVSLGDYQFGASPDEPMVLHMCHVPYFQEISGPEQWRAGRRQLLATPFETFENNVLEQLDHALGGAGFDAERDIEAITVNRWAHGYSYSPDLLWEPDWPDEASKPWVIGRQPYGHIAIANSDAGAESNTNSAMTHGYRAVEELLNA